MISSIKDGGMKTAKQIISRREDMQLRRFSRATVLLGNSLVDSILKNPENVWGITGHSSYFVKSGVLFTDEVKHGDSLASLDLEVRLFDEFPLCAEFDFVLVEVVDDESELINYIEPSEGFSIKLPEHHGIWECAEKISESLWGMGENHPKSFFMISEWFNSCDPHDLPSDDTRAFVEILDEEFDYWRRFPFSYFSLDI